MNRCGKRINEWHYGMANSKSHEHRFIRLDMTVQGGTITSRKSGMSDTGYEWVEGSSERRDQITGWGRRWEIQALRAWTT
jgi:hypothetical protein